MTDTAVFLLHAAIAALLAMAVLFLPARAQGRRALLATVMIACIVLSAVWLTGVALVPVVAPPVARMLRWLIGITVTLGPWLAGIAAVATVEALRQRTDGMRTARRLIVGLSIYVALNFFGFEAGKAWHDAEMRQFFEASGYPVWAMYVVMGVETACALALLSSRLRLPAAGVLALVMLGAIATHARNGDPFADSLDALRMLLMLGYILLLTAKARGWPFRSRAAQLAP